MGCLHREKTKAKVASRTNEFLIVHIEKRQTSDKIATFYIIVALPSLIRPKVFVVTQPWFNNRK